MMNFGLQRLSGEQSGTNGDHVTRIRCTSDSLVVSVSISASGLFAFSKLLELINKQRLL